MISRLPELFKKSRRTSFRPDFIVRNVFDIDFDKLAGYGIKVCLIDLDDTVVERGKFAISDQTIQALRHSGMRIFIATNRPKSRDLKNLRIDLGSEGVIHPKFIFSKPSKKYYEYALQDNNLKRSEVVMIGDRYIQDILGANRAGIYSLLVRKLGVPQGPLDKLISAVEKFYTDKIAPKYFR